MHDGSEQQKFELPSNTCARCSHKEGMLTNDQCSVSSWVSFSIKFNVKAVGREGICTLWISTKPTLTVYSASLLELMRWKMLSMTFGMTP